MGEPAVPDEKARAEALELADRILDAIRNDEWPPELKRDLFCDRATVERSLWLLAASLVWYRDPDAPDR